MSQRTRMVVLGGLCVAGLALYASQPPSANAALAAWTMGGGEGEDACTLSCEACVFESFEGEEIPFHVAPREGDTNQYKDGYHDTYCYSGTCDQKHPSCNNLIAQADVREAAFTGNAKRLAALVRENREKVQLERGALQFLGCDGEVVAHIPLPAEITAMALE